jgi:hypothetical protein
MFALFARRNREDGTEEPRMTDSEKPITGEHTFNGSTQPPQNPQSSSEAGRALLVGVLGGLVSAAGYLVYRRLPDEQRDRLNSQVRSLVESRISEIRSNLNL